MSKQSAIVLQKVIDMAKKANSKKKRSVYAAEQSSESMYMISTASVRVAVTVSALLKGQHEAIDDKKHKHKNRAYITTGKYQIESQRTVLSSWIREDIPADARDHSGIRGDESLPSVASKADADDKQESLVSCKRLQCLLMCRECRYTALP